MKKTVLAVIAIFVLSLTSCKKDYKCECSKTRTSGGTTVITDDGSYTFKDTRTRAESRCNDEEKSGTDVIGDYTRNCDIK